MLVPSYKDHREKRVQRFGFDPDVSAKILKKNRCFILGLGPSLAKVDPVGLKDEFVIGTNFVLRTSFVPDVVCVVDNTRFDYENWLKSRIKVITVKQIAERRPDKIGDLNAYHDIDYIDYWNGLKRSILTVDDFDDRLETVNFAGSVITDLAIPFACYLGFKEIYVLGLDGAAASFPSTHIFGHEANYSAAHPSHMFHMHERSASIAKKRGIQIFNASPGGVVWAFDRIPLEEIRSAAVRNQYDRDIHEKFVVLAGRVAQVFKYNGGYRIVDVLSGKIIRHKNNNVFLDKDDGDHSFEKDTTYIAEPSFTNEKWVSFRSSNVKNKYITSLDETTGYKLRRVDDLFSPYFSSFRIYDSQDRAAQRIENDRSIRNLATVRLSIGNAMIADDKLD